MIIDIGEIEARYAEVAKHSVRTREQGDVLGLLSELKLANRRIDELEKKLKLSLDILDAVAT